MIIPTEELLKRQFFCNSFNGVCVNNGFVTWGRWVLLGVIIVFFLILAFSLRTYSSRRVKSGKAPITGTGWMVPPSYYQSEQQYNTQGPPPAPPYNPAPGHQDAGYYDNQGNFIQNTNLQGAPPMEPPQQSYEMHPYDRKGGHDQLELPEPIHINDSGSSNYYAPPPGPPPGIGIGGEPPLGPPPGHPARTP